MNRNGFILSLIGHLSISSRCDRKDLKIIHTDLLDNLPSIEELKDIKHMSRTEVEKFLTGDYEVRVYTRIAEAIKKNLR